MKVKAVDETELCLRFKTDANDIQTTGVPTTLVFEAAAAAASDDMSNEQRMDSSGNCFENLAIETRSCCRHPHSYLFTSARLLESVLESVRVLCTWTKHCTGT